MKLTIYLIPLLILFSCGKLKSSSKNNNPIAVIDSLQPNRAFNAEEESTLTNACRLLRDKREYFLSEADKRLKFNFKKSYASCGSPLQLAGNVSSELRVFRSSNSIKFQAQTRGEEVYFPDILTEKNGFISPYCENLMAGNPVTKIMPLGSRKVQLNISMNQNYIILAAGLFKGNERSAYSIEQAAIHTSQTTADSTLYGVLKERNVSWPCSTGGVKIQKQDLL